MRWPVLAWLVVVASVASGACAPARPPPIAAVADPPELLGRWELQAEPRRIVELRPGGTGTIDGQPLRWSVDGDRLTVTDPGGTDTTGWRVEGDRLVLAGPFDSQIVLVRRR
jgi:hypothetical protein